MKEWLKYYGEKSIFEKRVEEGYSEVAFGGGRWFGKENGDDERMVAIWVFYHPDGRIATYEHPKYHDGIASYYGNKFEAEYTQDQFQEHMRKYMITLEVTTGLVELVENWGQI
jgi:hypothetical protein